MRSRPTEPSPGLFSGAIATTRKVDKAIPGDAPLTEALAGKTDRIVRPPLGPPVCTPAIIDGLACRFASISLDDSFEHTADGERRLALYLHTAACKHGPVAIPYHVFAERPATEPVLASAWTSLLGQTTETDIDGLASALLGRLARRRSGPSATVRSNDGSRSVFPPPEVAGGWFGRLEEAERASRDPFALALFAYAQTVLSHPYEDGNGRLGRAMFTRALARGGWIDAPVLPLGPLVYANHRVHDRALQHLGGTGDWEPLVRVMVGLTRKALSFVTDLNRSSAAHR